MKRLVFSDDIGESISYTPDRMEINGISAVGLKVSPE
jgi:hypothetical protein